MKATPNPEPQATHCKHFSNHICNSFLNAITLIYPPVTSFLNVTYCEQFGVDSLVFYCMS